MNNEIKIFLTEIGTTKKIKKGDFLFKADENDTNLYFLNSGKLILLNSEDIIAYIQDNELLGEKSFVNKSPKPISAQIIEDGEALIVSHEDFENLDSDKKITLLKHLMLYVSHRVDMLNTIISNIKIISEKMYQYTGDPQNENVKDIFNNIYDISNFVVFKNEYGVLSKIIGDIYLDESLENMIINQGKQELKFIADDDKILYVVTNDYTYYFKGTRKLDSYIVNNIFLYLRPVFHMFAEKLENIRNKAIQDSIQH